jgi:hypothetical protein
MKRLMKRLFRRGETGQSIVILAIGFIGLLAVVGITTDVSLMFVRYSSLRRAVDSAAIAAAGQMRQDREQPTVELTARQYIEFHGLNPEKVRVNACGWFTEPQIANPGNLEEIIDEVCTEDQRKLVRVSATIRSPTIFLRLIGFGDVELTASAVSETAVLDVVMIMDVSESMLEETTYEDWGQVGLGMAYYPPVIEGNTPNIWQSAANGYESVFAENVDLQNDGVEPLKIAPTYFDGTNGTVYPANFDPTNPGYPYDTAFQEPLANYTWPTVGNTNARFNDWINWFWQEYLLGLPQATINDRLYFMPQGQYIGNSITGVPTANLPAPVNGDGTAGNPPSANVAGWEDTTFEPNRAYPVRSFIPNDVAALGTPQGHPRSECRVRFMPTPVPLTDYIEETYTQEGLDWPMPASGGGAPHGRWNGFQPTYNFYGCCNDPTSGGTVDEFGNITPGASNGADGDFSDLVCQPFKQAKDATRLFLDRVDFLRGDRVAFVTFDRSAFIIDPDGQGDGTHMIESSDIARETLDRFIGVRAEPNFYVWNDVDGGWTHNVDGTSRTVYAQGIDRATGLSIPAFYDQETVPQWVTDNGYTIRDPLDYNNYPVRSNCYFQNATLPWPKSRAADPTPGAPFAGQALAQIMNPRTWEAGSPWEVYRSQYNPAERAYEGKAQCRGTNIGGALRAANAALTDPTTERREGTVWIMILLSDGAAGASDPVRQRGDLPDTPSAYTQPPVPGEYGIYGLCPYGMPTNPSFPGRGELVEGDAGFPFCSDEQVHTRQFCTDTAGGIIGQSPGGSTIAGDTGFYPGGLDNDYDFNQTPQQNLDAGRIYDVDIGDYRNSEVTNCHPLYDVDDYARDWADFVAGIERSDWCDTWASDNARCTGEGGEAVLPTIFTIGFGLNFENGAGDCGDNVEDCLGEELLRYIADAGDNFQIDTDYQQAMLEAATFAIDGWGSIDDHLAGDYGTLDPCQFGQQTWDPTNPSVVPDVLNSGESCGNYYNAPTQIELEKVFDDIASRMFTRLTG